MIVDFFRDPDQYAEARRVDSEESPSPDVLVMYYEGGVDYFLQSAMQNLKTLALQPQIDWSGISPFENFPYSQTWEKLAKKMAENLGAFMAIHWRQETVTSHSLPECADSLLQELRYIHQRFPSLKTVYLATDFPIELLERGQMDDKRIKAHSDTFTKSLNQNHIDSIQRILDAFSSGEMGDMRLTTLAREISSGILGDIDIADLDAGVVAILDKNVAMDAEVFLAGAPRECGRASSFTQMIINQRVLRMKNQLVEDGERVLQHGLTWNTVRVSLFVSICGISLNL